MEKRTKIAIVSITLILILAVLFSWTIASYKEKSRQGESVVKTEEEIINIFKDNKNMFFEAAENLYPLKYHWTLNQTHFLDMLDINVRDDIKDEYINSKIKVEIVGKENFNNLSIIKDVVGKNTHVENILIELKFESITTYASIDSNCLYFVENLFGDIGSGIVYCPENLPKNPYITIIKEIEPSWYYFDSK